MTVTLTIQFFSTFTVLAFWMWTRRRDRQEISRLALELTACRSTLHEFMQETEATFAVFSRMVHKPAPAQGVRAVSAATNRILPEIAPVKVPALATAANAAAPTFPTRRTASKKTQVLKLADKGLPSAEIANQLTIPQGEIDLILNLNGRAARC
jgi:DNA-binding NarL/FixJ family response regulator